MLRCMLSQMPGDAKCFLGPELSGASTVKSGSFTIIDLVEINDRQFPALSSCEEIK